jgi:S-adenosyl-methyltransferase MraW
MHKSVLLEECIQYLNLNDESNIVDCTLGYGGHSSEILKRIKRGFLFAFDQDKEAIEASINRLDIIGANYEIINSNFSNLKNELEKRNVSRIDGILYDLGVSSPQLDVGDRGFSFHQDAKLDMRMDQTQYLSAYEVVNNYDYDDLVSIFYKYGEEKFARSIAKKIIESRPINTTLELSEVIKNSVPEKYRREKHPARKVFQAIRIEVNNELNVFEDSLKQSLDVISVGGRICVITFHSLEDKICKEIFKEISAIDSAFKDLPIIPDEYLPKFKVIKTLSSSKEELEDNPRARSAKLRVIERIG